MSDLLHSSEGRNNDSIHSRSSYDSMINAGKTVSVPDSVVQCVSSKYLKHVLLDVVTVLREYITAVVFRRQLPSGIVNYWVLEKQFDQIIGGRHDISVACQFLRLTSSWQPVCAPQLQIKTS